MKTFRTRIRYSNGVESGWLYEINNITELDKYINMKESNDNDIANVFDWVRKFAFENSIDEVELIHLPIDVIVSPYQFRRRSYEVRLHALMEYGCIYVNESGGWFYQSENDDIIERVITEDFKRPKYDRSAIKINRWKGGEHYYACIGDIDVVDDKGNQKWDSYEEALRQSEKVLINLQ